jgi:hypothetical protein
VYPITFQKGPNAPLSDLLPVVSGRLVSEEQAGPDLRRLVFDFVSVKRQLNTMVAGRHYFVRKAFGLDEPLPPQSTVQGGDEPGDADEHVSDCALYRCTGQDRPVPVGWDDESPAAFSPEAQLARKLSTSATVSGGISCIG